MKKMFGKRLRELRRLRNMTQERVSELIGIKPENYSRIENGLSFPKPENILKISEVLNVDVYELFRFDNPKNYQATLEKVINKLKQDEQATFMTYNYLTSVGKMSS